MPYDRFFYGVASHCEQWVADITDSGGRYLPIWVAGTYRFRWQLITDSGGKVLPKYAGKGRSCTKPGTLLKKHIPIKTNQWDEKKPGFIEADTVAHCGGSLQGEHVWTLDCVDIATGWTEQRATFGKGYGGVLDAIKDIEKSLPFPLLGFDSDNGNEFLNHHLWRYCEGRRKNPVQFTRSREYHSDDNVHIEQKNWTHVRQWFGYRRLDDPEVVGLMNELYTSEWNRFHNFFLPSVKLISKHRVASKTIKKHDSPQTPYQRILKSPYIDKETKRMLQKEFERLNPFDLRKQMEQKLAKILRSPYIRGVA